MITEADIVILKDIVVDCMQEICKFNIKIPSALYGLRDNPRQILQSDSNIIYWVFSLESLTRRYVGPDKKDRFLNLLFEQQKKILIDAINLLGNSANLQQIDNQTTLTYMNAFAIALGQLTAQLQQQPITAEIISLVTGELAQLTSQHIEQTESTNQSNFIRVTLGLSKTHQYLQRLKEQLLVLNNIHRSNTSAKACTAVPPVAILIEARRLPNPFTEADVTLLHSINLQSMQAICQQQNQQIPSGNYEFRKAKSNDYTVAFLEKHLNALEIQSERKYPMFRAKLYTAKILQYIQQSADLIDLMLKQRIIAVDRNVLQELQVQLNQLKDQYAYNEQNQMDKRKYFTRLSYVICLLNSLSLMNIRAQSPDLIGIIAKFQTKMNEMREELFGLQLSQEETYFCIDEQQRHQVNDMVNRYKSVVRQRQQLQQHSLVTSSLFHHNELTELNKKIAEKIIGAVNNEGVIAKEEKAGLIMHLALLQNNINEKRATYTDTTSMWKGYITFAGLMFEAGAATYGVGLLITMPVALVGLIITTGATLGIHAASPGEGKLSMSIGETRNKLIEELNNEIWDKPNDVLNTTHYNILEAR